MTFSDDESRNRKLLIDILELWASSKEQLKY